YRRLLAEFIVDTNSPFSILESKSFRSLLQYCNSQTVSVSSNTLRRDIQKMHDQLLSDIKSRLQRHVGSGGNVNLTLDAWTLSNKYHTLV
ncbi:hypothetical protein P167DRAFT_596939, partial [Morchella conica CCBAS932]